MISIHENASLVCSKGQAVGTNKKELICFVFCRDGFLMDEAAKCNDIDECALDYCEQMCDNSLVSK